MHYTWIKVEALLGCVLGAASFFFFSSVFSFCWVLGIDALFLLCKQAVRCALLFLPS